VLVKGVLLVNLGTPAAPEKPAVAAYLREFLSDSRVVDLPRWLWLPLLYGVIVPLRSARSAAAYRKVWTAQGSPLLVNSQRIASALAGELGPACAVRLAMRYGTPGVATALRELREAGADQLVVLPLYPQFSHTTVSSVFDAVDAGLATLDWRPALHKVSDYHDDAGWVAAVADSIRRYQSEHGRPRQLLFSMHGIPQRYVEAGDPYAAQCQASVQAIAAALGLGPADYLLTFQSRVGREPWLQPYTDVTLLELAASGSGDVQVVCPGFAADCLEALEEINLMNREAFEGAGGHGYGFIPCLNDQPAHVRALADIIRRSPAA
jgi:ferrochelatase